MVKTFQVLESFGWSTSLNKVRILSKFLNWPNALSVAPIINFIVIVSVQKSNNFLWKELFVRIEQIVLTFVTSAVPTTRRAQPLA
jgi:hypothetical protein